MATSGELVSPLQHLAEPLSHHDHPIKALTEVLQKTMEPPPPGLKRSIGFQAPDSNGAASQENPL